MAKTSKRILRLSAAALLGAFLFSGSVLAVSDSDITALQTRIEHLEEALTEQQTRIDELENKHSLIIERKSALDQQIRLNREEIDLLEQQVKMYDAMIDEKAAELEQARSAELTQSRLLRERIRRMEETGSGDYLSFLFRAQSLTDLLSRLTDVNAIMSYDKHLEKQYSAAREDVQSIMDEYSAVQLRQEKVRSELRLKEEQLAGQVNAACMLITQLDELSDDAAKEYEAIEKAEQEAWQEQLNALAQLAAQQAAASTQYSASYSEKTGTVTVSTTTASGETKTATFSSSGLIWPTASSYITSGFGLRAQPTAGASTNHQAIDIGGQEGDPIYAAADGSVAVATYNDGLGYYVLLQHDGSLSTRYSHLSTLCVSAGQYVTQGQIIGYMGSTGIATGSHLDYAVINNGEKVDPLGYYDTSSLTFDPTA